MVINEAMIKNYVNEGMIKNYVKGLSDEKYMQLRNLVVKGIEEEDNRRGI